MKRIAVLVSGGGTNLQALIDAQGRGEIINGSIAAVISSSPDAYALERAEKAGIPGYVIDRRDYPSNRAMTAALVDKLHQLDIQLAQIFQEADTLLRIFCSRIYHPAIYTKVIQQCRNSLFRRECHKAQLDTCLSSVLLQSSQLVIVSKVNQAFSCVELRSSLFLRQSQCIFINISLCNPVFYLIACYLIFC